MTWKKDIFRGSYQGGYPVDNSFWPRGGTWTFPLPLTLAPLPLPQKWSFWKTIGRPNIWFPFCKDPQGHSVVVQCSIKFWTISTGRTLDHPASINNRLKLTAGITTEWLSLTGEWPFMDSWRFLNRHSTVPSMLWRSFTDLNILGDFFSRLLAEMFLFQSETLQEVMATACLSAVKWVKKERTNQTNK